MTPESHRLARQKIQAAWPLVPGLPPPTPARLQLAASVMALETSYGNASAWARNTPALASSHNWGAVTCATCGQPDCVQGHDSTQAGTPTTPCFRMYPDDAHGIAAVLSFFTKGQKKAAMERATSTRDFAGAMYADHYFGASCPEAVKQYGRAATDDSGNVNAGGATSDAGRACDAEAIGRYATTLAHWTQEIADAHGEEAVPLDAGGDDAWWKWVILVAAIGGAAYVAMRAFGDPESRRKFGRLRRSLLGERRNPRPDTELRENPSRQQWERVRRGICGKEREARRQLARREIRELDGRQKTREGRRHDLLEDADRPCREATEEMHEQVRYERGERAKRSARRTPAQHRASRRALERYEDRVDAETYAVEGEKGELAAKYFKSHARHYFGEAKRRGNIAPYEVFLEELEASPEAFERWRDRELARREREEDRQYASQEGEDDYEEDDDDAGDEPDELDDGEDAPSWGL